MLCTRKLFYIFIATFITLLYLQLGLNFSVSKLDDGFNSTTIFETDETPQPRHFSICPNLIVTEYISQFVQNHSIEPLKICPPFCSVLLIGYTPYSEAEVALRNRHDWIGATPELFFRRTNVREVWQSHLREHHEIKHISLQHLTRGNHGRINVRKVEKQEILHIFTSGATFFDLSMLRDYRNVRRYLTAENQWRQSKGYKSAAEFQNKELLLPWLDGFE